MFKAWRFVVTILLTCLWAQSFLSEFLHTKNSCGVSFNGAQDRCIHGSIFSESYNTTMKRKRDKSLYFVKVNKIKGKVNQSKSKHHKSLYFNNNVSKSKTEHPDSRWAPWPNAAEGDIVCSPYRFVGQNLPDQCCYAIGGQDNGDQVSKNDDVNGTEDWCTANAKNPGSPFPLAAWPLMILGVLCFFADRCTAVYGQNKVGSSCWYRFLVADLHDFTVQGQRQGSLRSTAISCGMCFPFACDFLLAYFTFDLWCRFLALYIHEVKIQGSHHLRVKAWQHFLRLGIVALLTSMCIFRFITSASTLQNNKGNFWWKDESACGHYQTPCDIYFEEAMLFSSHAMVALVCFFHFHVSEIQVGVFKEMCECLSDIEADDSIKEHDPTLSQVLLEEDFPLNQPESCCGHSRVWVLFSAALSLMYAVWLFTFCHATFFHWDWKIVCPSLCAGLLVMQMDWALSVLSQSIATHKRFITATIGDDYAAQPASLEPSAATPFLDPRGFAKLQKLKIEDERHMRTFFKLRKLLNVREKEATFIMDHVISICVVVLLINVVSSSTTLVFKLISTTFHRPIFVYNVSTTALTMQATVNVVIWVMCLSRACASCLKYSQVIDKDAGYFKKKRTELLLAGGGDVEQAERALQVMLKAEIIKTRSEEIKRTGNSITFLGMPITQSMMNRMGMYKVLALLAIFFTWFLQLVQLE